MRNFDTQLKVVSALLSVTTVFKKKCIGRDIQDTVYRMKLTEILSYYSLYTILSVQLGSCQYYDLEQKQILLNKCDQFTECLTPSENVTKTY